jgi:hypothetical protein
MLYLPAHCLISRILQLLRRNDAAYLADKIYDKLLKDGNANAGKVRAKLMSVDGWYLPFKWK